MIRVAQRFGVKSPRHADDETKSGARGAAFPPSVRFQRCSIGLTSRRVCPT
jgi:hypothetical protein